MDLQLGAPPPGRGLIDGSTSWDSVAEGALATWNLYLTKVAFTYRLSSGAYPGDGVNQVFFSTNVYGQAFGSGILAVTARWSIGTTRTEADTIFNREVPWNSYRGNLQTTGGVVLNDLRRVALHEFGHTLGLDHPDQAGQIVVAIMNSHISDLDGLATDDVTGAQVLYGVAPPTIIAQPQSLTVTVGASASFTVNASGWGPFAYQWRFNGVNIPGATFPTFTISNAQTSQAGNYTVLVSNAGGTATSAAAVFKVNAPPTITTQPQSVVVRAGKSATFSASASGTAPLSYQWYRGNSSIAGATAASYGLSAAQASDAGGYKVRVNNVAGTVDSSVAMLTVQYAPAITAQPQGQTVSAGGSVTFTVAGEGVPSPTYQWRHTGINIAGATTSSCTLSNIRTNDAGNYRVVLSNSVGSVTSAVTVLTVVVPAFVSVNPQSQSVRAGSNVTFSAAGGGTSPLEYRWWRVSDSAETNTLADWTNSSLSLIDVQPADAADYYVEVSNEGGTASSTAAKLTVLSPPTITSQPLGQTVTVGDSAVFSVAATGTAPLSYQWRLNGTAVPAGTGAALIITNAQPSDAGAYSVTITNLFGYISSSNALFVVNQPPACVSPAPGLVSWWKAESNANDTAGNNSGALLNGATFAPGKVGQAFAFDGIRSYLRVADAPSLRCTNALTVEAWIYPTSVGAYHNIVSKWGIVDPYHQTAYTTGLFPDGRIYLGVSASGNGVTDLGASATSTNVIPANQWTHFAGTYDGTALRIYVNGVCESTVVYDQGIFPGMEDLAIGSAGAFADGGVVSPFEGRIDEPAVYNRALRADEIQAIYNAGSSGRCDLPPLALTISPAGINIRVAWPVSSAGYLLQEASSPAALWVNSSAPVVIQGNENAVVVAPTGKAKFYRLSK